ncbi:GNAT family N-acetyltransferase [Actinopolyspora xinjiangensis]|uniref:GNAT family N-acetyltransferase n=1 Tax=Actinopolyspora xinjiangensis TaxID=405564 RepID=UPI000B8A3D4E
MSPEWLIFGHSIPPTHCARSPPGSTAPPALRGRLASLRRDHEFDRDHRWHANPCRCRDPTLGHRHPRRRRDTPSPEEARPLIQQVVGAPGCTLFVASTATETVGFVAAKPRSSGCPNDKAEVRYPGVAPNSWGERIGSRLAQALPEHLRDRGFTRATLTAYTDNEPAVRLYRRHGWSPLDDPSPHPTTAKREQRYILEL